MSKETSIITLGILTAVLPFLGFPSAWRVVLFVFFGAGIAVIGFMLRSEALRRGSGSTHRAFAENGYPAAADIHSIRQNDAAADSSGEPNA